MAILKLNGGYECLVDDDDYGWISQHTWTAIRTNARRIYVNRKLYKDGKRTSLFLHRAIMAAVPGELVDHINNDPFDNRRCNLRICTKSQNNQNRGPNQGKQYKGVTFSSNLQKYQAWIRCDNKRYFLGTYDTPEAAARAYDLAALEYHQDFAWLNFPQTLYLPEVS